MSTTTRVHKPEPPTPGMAVTGGDGPLVAFDIDAVKFYVHDPQWFDAVAVWAKREALRLREAQAGVCRCDRCGHGGQSVDTGGVRLCAKCATAEVAA